MKNVSGTEENKSLWRILSQEWQVLIDNFGAYHYVR